MSKDLVALGIERESGQTAERSGGDLQVVGVLPVADWLAWAAHFASAVAGLPTFECA